MKRKRMVLRGSEELDFSDPVDSKSAQKFPPTYHPLPPREREGEAGLIVG